MLNKVVWLAFTLFSFFHGTAQTHTSEHLNENDVARDSVEAGFSHIHHFRFKDAAIVKNYLVNHHNEYYLTKFHNANYHWWKIISGYDTKDEMAFYDYNLAALKGYLQKDAEDLTNQQLYVLINAHAFKARIHVLNKNYIKALKEVNKTINNISLSFGKENEFAWFSLTSGIYNYNIEYAKKEYPLMFPYLITLPNGDKEKGLKQLQIAAANKNEILSTEANYFLMRIYLDKEKDYQKSRDLCSKLTMEYPLNLLFHYYAFLTELYDGNESSALKKVETMVKAGKKNKQVTDVQRSHFTELAKQDLKNYYLNSK